MHLGLRRALHWVGGGLCIAGIGFVALRMREYGAQLDFQRFDGADGSVALILAMLYAACSALLARAWWDILLDLRVSVSWPQALKIYGMSQLAKYVPGNIFHLAGRQSLGLAAGMPGWQLAKSTVWELGLISAAGALFIVLVLPLIARVVPTAAATLGFACAVLIGASALSRLISRFVARAFAQHVLFLVLSGLIFVGALDLVAAGGAEIAIPLPELCGAYVIAWLVGLVTPGAPAGLGIREAVLLFLLAGRVAEPDLVMAVLLGRIITVGGDILIFLFATSLGSGQIRATRRR